jgi:hypothetical protein
MWLLRRALADLYPPVGDLPGVAELDLDEFLLGFRRECPPLMWLGMILGAWAYTLSPIITVGWPLPSIWLPRPLRDRHAFAAATHRWYFYRQLIMVLKVAGGLCWGQHPRIRARHGLAAYGPDPGTWRGSGPPLERSEAPAPRAADASALVDLPSRRAAEAPTATGEVRR